MRLKIPLNDGYFPLDLVADNTFYGTKHENWMMLRDIFRDAGIDVRLAYSNVEDYAGMFWVIPSSEEDFNMLIMHYGEP